MQAKTDVQPGAEGEAATEDDKTERNDSAAARTQTSSVDTSPLQELSVQQVVETGALEPVYQPVVDLYSGEFVAYEGLIRGPRGSRLESPDQLFQQAAAVGLTAELDWACKGAVIGRAYDAGLRRQGCLFVNAEPATFGTEQPGHLETTLDRAVTEMTTVIEITERQITSNPLQLLEQVRLLRDHGFAIAVDDVGAEPGSLALLPFLEPDIIKLDLRLVQNYGTAEIATIANAVQADAERRGAVVLAEGIETAADAERAKVLGATLGQGWFFGRPGSLEIERLGAGSLWEQLPTVARNEIPPTTPWELVAHSDQVRTSTKRLLMPMSNHLESYASALHEQPIVLAAFQHANNFSPATVRRYTELAAHCALLGALGEGLQTHPAPGVRGGTIHPGHPLAGEWTVTVLGPHFSAALIARDLGDTGPEKDRRFDYVLTHDRDIVTAAAKSLLRMLDPASNTSERR